MNKRLPLGLLAILLIVLLAGVGVAYGLWSETLTINGTVQTGDVNVEFTDVNTTEGVAIDGVLTIPEPKEKAEAANCEAKILNQGTDNEILEITTTGAYPSWHCFVEFNITSTGSVPVHVYKPEPVQGYNNPDWALLECKIDESGFRQIHKDEYFPCVLTIHFTNDDGVQEKGTYTFRYSIEARQWNEPR